MPTVFFYFSDYRKTVGVKIMLLPGKKPILALFMWLETHWSMRNDIGMTTVQK